MRLRNSIRQSRALTLIEVMVALGVLVILVGGIFLVVQTSLRTVLMIDNQASREDEITNLTDILRSNFRNLPPRARLTAQPVPGNGTPEFLFIVRDAPGFLTWLAAPEEENTIVLLSLRQDAAEGGWRVCLKRLVPPENFPADDFSPQNILRLGTQIPWLELVSDFRSATARFYNASTQSWQETWDSPSERPALIQFHLVSELTRDTFSESPVLWIPPVKGGTS